MKRCIKCNHKAMMFYSIDEFYFKIKCSFCKNSGRQMNSQWRARRQWNHQNENVSHIPVDYSLTEKE